MFSALHVISLVFSKSYTYIHTSAMCMWRMLGVITLQVVSILYTLIHTLSSQHLFLHSSAQSSSTKTSTYPRHLFYKYCFPSPPNLSDTKLAWFSVIFIVWVNILLTVFTIGSLHRKPLHLKQ